MYKTASTAIPSSGSTAPAFPTLTQQDISDISTGGYTHYFMFVTDTAKPSFDSIVSGALFRCLPRGSTSEMTGAFTRDTRLVKKIDLVGACFTNNPTGDSQFLPMDLYTGSGTAYCPITTYFLNLKLRIYALDDLNTVLTTVPGGSTTGVQFELSRTFSSTSSSSFMATPTKMRNSSYTEVSTITIPAGGDQIVYFNFASTLDQPGGRVSEFQSRDILFNLYQRGVTHGSSTFNLRLSN